VAGTAVLLGAENGADAAPVALAVFAGVQAEPGPAKPLPEDGARLDLLPFAFSLGLVVGGCWLAEWDSDGHQEDEEDGTPARFTKGGRPPKRGRRLAAD
jgi:hypothetical protein